MPTTNLTLTASQLVHAGRDGMAISVQRVIEGLHPPRLEWTEAVLRKLSDLLNDIDNRDHLDLPDLPANSVAIATATDFRFDYLADLDRGYDPEFSVTVTYEVTP